jgi:hypothetical protein
MGVLGQGTELLEVEKRIHHESSMVTLVVKLKSMGISKPVELYS